MFVQGYSEILVGFKAYWNFSIFFKAILKFQFVFSFFFRLFWIFYCKNFS